MIRFILAAGLIAAGAWPSLQTEKIETVETIPAAMPDVDVKEKPAQSPYIFANFVSNEAPVDAPATTEDCTCENCDCDPCECKKPDSGWQPVEGASTQTVTTTGSAGSYAAAPASSAGSYAASSAGSYAASSAGSYAASSAGSYGSQEVYQVAHRQPVRRAARAIFRPLQGIRGRMAARREGRQSARHSRHSGHAPQSGACATCN